MAMTADRKFDWIAALSIAAGVAVMIPALGASPSYSPWAAIGDSSRKGLRGSSSASTRARGSSLPRGV